MKRVLVTGASGFLGQQCLQQLLLRDYEIHAISSSVQDKQNDIHWHQLDLSDYAKTNQIVKEVGATHLMHLAWRAAHSGLWNAMDNQPWVGISINLLDAFREHGGKRVVGVGSCGEYDWRQGICVEGLSPTQPDTFYGVCKGAVRDVFMDIGQRTDLSIAWARPFFIYGPGEHPSRLVSNVIVSLLKGEEALCSHGRQVRDYLHSQDVADGLVTLLESSVEETINISSGEFTSLRDIISFIGQELKKPELVKLGAREAAAHEPPVIIGDTRKMKELIGWQAKLTMEEGLKKTVDWWKIELGMAEAKS